MPNHPYMTIKIWEDVPPGATSWSRRPGERKIVASKAYTTRSSVRGVSRELILDLAREKDLPDGHYYGVTIFDDLSGSLYSFTVKEPTKKEVVFDA